MMERDWRWLGVTQCDLGSWGRCNVIGDAGRRYHAIGNVGRQDNAIGDATQLEMFGSDTM